MKTTILISEHSRALDYLNLYDKCKDRLVSAVNSYEWEKKRDNLHRFLFYPEQTYINQIERQKNLLMFIKNRYFNVIDRINNYID